MFYLDSHEAGSMTKSAENCKLLCLEPIQKAKEEYDCGVNAVVTDNIKSMEAIRKELVDHGSDLMVYGCTLASITKHIDTVQKYFRTHHRPQTRLVEKVGRSLSLLGIPDGTVN